MRGKRSNIAEIDICLNCTLPECIDTSRKCVLRRIQKEKKRISNQKYYQKHREEILMKRKGVKVCKI